MKTRLLKISAYLLLSFLITNLIACDSDDDLQVVVPVTNVFCYGPDSTSTFETRAAFNNDVIEEANNVFRTTAFLTDGNITADSNGALQGAGVLMDVVLYGNQEINFQSGTYLIDGSQDVGRAFISYDIDFDSNSTDNRGIRLVSGNVKVRPYLTGFAIEIDGVDINGDRFHGIFLGNITEI
ncbi:hypothetical protein LX97_01838 [Nonlabens dokdonensis]|jgi:hypothetical protein|uniref:DUF5689 domain-containing protein n=1 Tax=Nonlabens dokdonensis TaxID=328515 RepID=A0ABX5PYR1_9FLAO|nr:hypothetical protein [Nonlabens dokdonensis]PZX41057.1 hypothetical protein LX97_01838 [Nonlabens dokdonensis]